MKHSPITPARPMVLQLFGRRWHLLLTTHCQPVALRTLTGPESGGRITQNWLPLVSAAEALNYQVSLQVGRFRGDDQVQIQIEADAP